MAQAPLRRIAQMQYIGRGAFSGAGMDGARESDLLSVIGLAYDAALAGGDWTVVLGKLASCLNGHSAMLRMADYTRRDIRLFDTFGYSPALPERYREHLIEIDPYRDGFEIMPIGRIVTVDEYLGPRNRRRGEFYNLYERPNGAEYTIGVALSRKEAFTLHLGIHRGASVGEFGADAREFLARVVPHLARAVLLREALATASARQQMTESALDVLHVGVAITDAKGTLLFINRAGERFVAASRGSLRIERGRLKAQPPRDAARLSASIGQASMTTAGHGVFAGSEMRLHCEDGPALQLFVTPLSRARLGPEFKAPAGCAALFFCRPGSVRLNARNVAQLYGLTPAEARLAVRLAKGEGAKQAAERLGVSPHTVRAQTKAIFAKTGCRRQSELVSALLQGILPQLDREEN